MKTAKSVIRAAVLFLAVFVSGAAWAQTPTGAISGTVIDAQGLAVADADVTLTNQQTNYTYKSKTSSSGSFGFLSIDYGNYSVTVEKEGFRKGVVQYIKLDAATVFTVAPLRLEVGQVTETVEVQASAASINTTSVEVSSTVEKQQIDDLPILDRRALALLGLEAGVNNTGSASFLPTTINGQRTSLSNMTLDGINIQDNYIRDNGLDFSPNLPINSQAQEFTVINQNGDVDQGGGASQVSFVTPKGSNDFHGEGFWYYRSNDWAANDWFNNASGVAKPNLLQNQGGGNIGGPIIKNKLFVYGYYEFLRLRQQATEVSTVLSPAIRAALSSATPTLPFTYQPVDSSGNAVGGPQTVDLFTLENQARGPAAPVFTADPAMLQVLARVPSTSNNSRVGDGVNSLGYQFNERNNDTKDNSGIRVDYDLNAANSFTATYAWNRQVTDRPDVASSFDTVPKISNNEASNFLSTAWRWNPRSDFTNEVRFGFNLAPANFITTQKFGAYVLDDTKLAFTDPDPNFPFQGRTTHTWSWQDNATWSKGNHTIKFGTQIQRVMIFTTTNGSDSAGIYPTYQLGFSQSNPGGPLTSDFPAPSNASISDTARGNATSLLASVAGVLNQVTQTLNATSQTSGYIPFAPENRNYSQNDISLYLGDSWKIKPRLTLTVGVRWEHFGPVNERDGLFLEPVIQPGSTVQQTLLGNASIDFAGGPSALPIYQNQWRQFAPNIGVAWDPFGDGKTAVRAGFSVNYANDRFFTAVDNASVGNTGLQAAPINVNSSVQTTVSNPQGVQIITPPPFQIPTTFMINADNQSIPVAAYSIDPQLHAPYVEQWNLSIQRDLGWNTSLTVSYYGNHGVGLFRAIDLNQLVLQQNGFLADFKRARSNGFLALAANPSGGFVPDYNPLILGSQMTPVLNSLQSGGLLDFPLVTNLIEQGQVGTLSGIYHANGFDTDSSNLPGPNDPVALFPNPYLLGADLLKNGSFSTYNAAVVEVRRRFSKGLYFQANYTYSKVMTDYGGSQSQFQPYQDNARPGLEKQRAPFDLTHAFKANFTYELPIGKGHKLFASTNRALGLLLDGWQTSSIFTWQSGAPFSILSEWGSFNRGLRTTNNTAVATLTHQQISGDLGTFKLPNGSVYVINPKLVSPDGTGIPANPQLSCTPAVTGGFCNPQPGEVGNLQLDAFNGPAYFDWDASAGKDFNVTERAKLTFRAEAFNVVNHPVFSTTQTDPISLVNVNEELINSNTFGQSTSTVSTPRILQLSLRLKF